LIIGIEVSEIVGGIGPRTHKGCKVEGFRFKVREDIKGVSRNGNRRFRGRDNSGREGE